MKKTKLIRNVAVILTMIFLFMSGTLLGIAITYNKNKELINNQYIELDNSREVIDKLTQENERLKTILNNYTIEERKEGNQYAQ